MLCFFFMFYPINIANTNAIKAMGKTSEILKLEIIKKVFGICAVFATIWISIEAVAYSLIAVSIFELIINAVPNKKILGFSFFDLLKLIMPSLVISLIMGLFVYFVSPNNTYGVINLDKQVSIGVSIYFLLAAVFKLKAFSYLKNLILRIFSK